MSTLQVTRLESLIHEKICSLGYVMRVGYIDDGREVTVLIVHYDDPGRVSKTIDEIADRGMEIEKEIPDRMISPLEIDDGPDLPEGIISGSKAICERAARQWRPRRRNGTEAGRSQPAALRAAWPGGPHAWKAGAPFCSALRRAGCHLARAAGPAPGRQGVVDLTAMSSFFDTGVSMPAAR